MRALHRKLLRDLRRRAVQLAAIAAVMASGIATFVMSLSMLDSLSSTLDEYYERSRFAHVFTNVKRAPNTLLERIAEIPGVASVEGRVVESVRLDMPGLPELASAWIVSAPTREDDGFNLLHLRSGRMPELGGRHEALVSEAFAEAHGLGPGSEVRAIMNGRMEELHITGVALSPEFIYLISPGAILPDDLRFGALWMQREDIAAAFDMEGAFNDALVRLTPTANEEEVIAAIDGLTDRYGGLGAYAREEQASHEFLSNELRELRGMATFVPVIFLSVAAFLLNIVLSRMVAAQREQIAVLKALGYGGGAIARHYLGFALAVTLVSTALGVLAGVWMGRGLTGIYANFFNFPTFTYRADASIILLSLVVAAAAAGVAVVGALRSVVRLPAAEAMRPKPPESHRPTIVERFASARLLTTPGRMVLRHLERRPLRALLSCAGVALATSILVVGQFSGDAINHVIDLQFGRVQRYDVDVALQDRTDDSAVASIRGLPGVLRAEPRRTVAVKVRVGHREERTGVLGLSRADGLHRLLDLKGAPVALPEEGAVLSETLAALLGVGLGDSVRLHALEGRRMTVDVPVRGLIADFSGKAVYMRLDHLNKLFREERSVSGIMLDVDQAGAAALYTELRDAPRVAAVNVKTATVATFQDTVAKNLETMRLFVVAFAVVIAFGVIYNSAKISLAERSRDLATMRVIGFTRREIASVQLGELAVITLVSIPLGLAIGCMFSWMTSRAMQTELFRLPFVLRGATLANSALVVLAASVVSAALVRRDLLRLDPLAALKTRE